MLGKTGVGICLVNNLRYELFSAHVGVRIAIGAWYFGARYGIGSAVDKQQSYEGPKLPDQEAYCDAVEEDEEGQAAAHGGWVKAGSADVRLRWEIEGRISSEVQSKQEF